MRSITFIAGMALLGFPTLAALAGEATVLESRRLHLGKAGQWEWDLFKDKPVDAERLRLTFTGKANATEECLRIWQRDVKQGWPVLLNGRRLGGLVAAETALECVLAIPPGALKDGENVLEIPPPNLLDDIEVGPVLLEALPVAQAISGASLAVAVTDGQGKGLPSRLTLTRRDGTLQPLRAEPAGEVASRVGVVYTRAGKARLSVPPGDYVLHAGRGFEWGIARVELSLKAGESRDLSLRLTREVDTTGWIAVDSHIHTLTDSGHGDALIDERMLTIAGEGIELAVATDHNHHADYAPAAARMGVTDHFTPVVGNEVTTKQGHFNAFPVAPGAPVVDHREEDWGKLIPAIRATPGVQVVTLNHPRDLHGGFIPLGEFQFNPRTGQHRRAAAMDLTAIEVITSAAMQSDVHLLYRDWFALLNRGHRVSAIASSDTHDVNRFILGQGRTYVAAADGDPARLNLEEVWRGYREGRLLASLGLLAKLSVDGRFGVGDLATGLGGEIVVEGTVSGPSWIKADRVELYANGELLRAEAVEDAGKAGEKARFSWKLPRPAHDVSLVLIATGPGVTEPFWEIPRPYQASSKALTLKVVGSTNPVWVDADGDGRFESAFEIAKRMVKEAGGDRAKLAEALRRCDAAVAIQVETLLPANP